MLQLTVTDSAVTGNSMTGSGAVVATVNNASLIIANSSITDAATSGGARNSALGVFGRSLSLTGGSVATGDVLGAWIYNDSPLTPTDRLSLTVSDSTLMGTKGAAILVGGLAPREQLEVDTPQNRYEVQAGAQLRLGTNWAAWGQMNLQRGDSGYRNVIGQLGLRRSW